MADSSSQQPSLTVLGGPMAGQRLVLDESVANLLIGSDPSCDFYLPHDSVSPIHARLWMDLDGAVLHETSSPHGVYINDERVEGKHPLHNGDIIWLGPPGGANVVMIQCVLAEKPAEEAAAPAAEDRAADEERETLEALAPTLAAGASLARLDDHAPDAEPPAWEPAPEPPPLPVAASAAPMDFGEDVGSQTVAFRAPDFASAEAAPPPAPEPPPVPHALEEVSPAPPPVPSRGNEFDTLWVEHAPQPPPVPVAPPVDETILESHSYGDLEPEPTIVGGEPMFAEPDPEPTMIDLAPPAHVAAPEPEPEIIEPLLPEVEATQVMAAGVAPAMDAASSLPSDFDDMVFSVPDEAQPPARPAAPAPPPPIAAAPDPEALGETVLLPAAPQPQPVAAPPPPPAPPRPAAPAPAAAPSAPAAASAPARPAAPRPATPPAASGTGRQTPIRPATPATAGGTGRQTPVRPAARPAAAAAPARSGGGLPVAVLAGAGVLVAVAAGAGYWFLGRSEPAQQTAVATPPPVAPPTQPPAPEPTIEAATPEPVPEPVAEATPEPVPTVAPAEDVVTIVKTTPPPRPSAAPTAAATPRPATPRPDPVDPAAAARARTAAQVTALLGQAGAAVSARNYDAAATHYDEVLRLDPQNATAQTGKASVAASRAHARKAFVAGRTVVRTAKAGGGLAGFDSSGVNLQKAPDFQGRVEYEMSPASVQPGDAWQLKIYIVNEGKKPIKISALEVATTVNGAPSGAGGPPRNREVAPQQRAIVDELSGKWPEGVTSWRTEVKVSAGKNDSLQSQLTWR